MKKNIRKLAVPIIMFAISLFFINLIDVKGAAQGNGTNYAGGKFNGCGGENCMWSQQVGIRFSLVDENGNKVSGTSHIDAWIYSKLNKSIKIYDLYDNDGTLLWNFTGAWYGNQIKQEYFSSPAGLVEGPYWSLSHIRHLEDIFPESYLLSVYNRWEAGWVHHVATYIINNTSDTDTSLMDSILIELGYKDGSAAASAAGYYLQYEPIVLNGRIGNAITNYIFIGTPTEYKAYDQAKSGRESPYFAQPGAPGIAIYRAGEGEAPNIFTTGSGNDDNLLKRDGSGKIYGEGVAHIWIRDLVKPSPSDCNSIVAMINEWYSTDKISQEEYDEYIVQVKDGTFVYKDEETNIEYKIEGKQDYEFLIKENYDKYNEGLAACANREKTSQDCEAALEYINSNYRRNTIAYHAAVDQVEAGTFSYELYDGTTVTIDKPYSYDMLVKETYTRRGGIAKCENMIDSCEIYYGSEVYIDDCTTGNSYLKDLQERDAWLTCEIAYSVGSKIYSSDNTGHDAVETTDGGIVGNTEYCEVFCKESIETFFPKHVYNVKAGQTFTWGISGETFGTVTIRKECSNQNYVKYQQGYRFEEWEEDYKNNEEAMIEHFMKNGAYESMISGITSSSSSYNTCDYRCSTCTTKSGTKYSCRCGYRGCPKWRATARSSGTSESYSHTYIGGVTGSVSSQSYSVRGYDSSSAAKSAAEAGLKSKLESLAAGEEAKYSQKKNTEAELIEKIEQCTNNIEYLYDTTIQFVFKEPVNGVYGANSRSFEFNDKLNVEGNYNQDNVDTSKCTEKTIYKYTCSGYASSVTCSAEAKQVLDCTVVTWDIQGTYTYKYPVEHFQWYSLKTDSTLVNENEKGSEDEAFFYSIGFGLPTALSLTDGKYELKAIVYDLGDKASFSGGNPKFERPTITHFDPLALDVDTNEGSKKGFEYICTYEVDNEIFGYDCQYEESGERTDDSPVYCDDYKDDNSYGSLRGVDITYRLVTLLSDGDSVDKAFPGKDGGGRQPGGNWSVGETTIQEILDADVYNEPAMYEIMLDVNAIQVIREDNQTYFNYGKDPYASYYDANNAQKVYCAVNGNEKYCASDFISDLYNGSGLNYRLLGTCLPTGNTLERAEYILENGCDTHYVYPTINWTR